MASDTHHAATAAAAPPRTRRVKPLKRRRDGCMNCRRKKRKCDRIKPQCTGCQKTKERCQWNQPLKFRPENALTIPDGPDALHGAAAAAASSSSSSSSDNEADEHEVRSPKLLRSAQQRQREVTPATKTTGANAVRSPSSAANVSDTAIVIPRPGPTDDHTMAELIEQPVGDLDQAICDRAELGSRDSSLMLNNTTGAFPLPSIVSPTASFYPAATAPPPNGSSPTTRPSTASDPFKSDGVFLPGSEFREFHNLLRDGMLNTITGDGSVTPGRPLPAAIGLDSSYTPQHQSAQPQRNSLDPVALLTQELEADLWKNWIDEVSTWIDKFDPHAHFRHTLPIMAQQAAHLRYAILALSARQLEMRDKILPAELSLALYQEAIHGVLPALEARGTAVLASCVVLCVLEMLSCSPQMWRRHLDGCASLIMGLDIRGDAGGIEQALFWCIVRMDVCGALISSEATLVPADRWTSSPSLPAAAATLTAAASSFEHAANHALLLLAHVLALLAHPPPPADYPAAWTALHARLTDWSASCPPQMHPVITRPSAPFDTVVYSSGAAISGNQLHHTAMLLLLQRRPRGARTVPAGRSALWHARRICAISLSNAHRGCWTNSIQPLWIAGQLMSHPSEHEALLGLFRRIEVETGWATAWRARDLEAHWGDLSC